MVETTALGAAGLAGLALGVWRSSAEFLGGRRFQRFEPRTTPAERRAAEGRLGAGRWTRRLAWAARRVLNKPVRERNFPSRTPGSTTARSGP